MHLTRARHSAVRFVLAFTGLTGLTVLAVSGAFAVAQSAPRPTRLVVPPLVVRPTASGATVNVVADRDDAPLTLRYRSAAAAETAPWQAAGDPTRPAPDVCEWAIDGLKPGAHYRYRVIEADGAPETDRVVASGAFVTQRPAGEAFRCALLADPHILVRDFTPDELAAHPIPAAEAKRYGGVDRAVWTFKSWRAYGHGMLPRVAQLAVRRRPDFVVNLGDMVDLHGFGFNVPVLDERWARKGFLDYRRLLGPLGARAAHFAVIGNWDGERGFFTDEERERSRSQRFRYLPNPGATTYPEGGSPHQDYYAFTWGDATFVVLNVISYTKAKNLLNRRADPGRPDAFTLGAAQRSWLERTLAAAKTRWRFVCIHHAVGGRGGDRKNSAYGRGGGRAAGVGEQAKIHALMVKHRVNAFFYGHDHVFTDMVVDGIHYTLPGSCGAPWKFSDRETGYEHYWPDSGFAMLDVAPEQVVVTFITADNALLHRYRIPARTPR